MAEDGWEENLSVVSAIVAPLAFGERVLITMDANCFYLKILIVVFLKHVK